LENYFLAIESATKTCSVALFKGSKLIDIKEENGAYSHAEKLAPYVEELLEQNALRLKQLDAIGISSGPGSYTGLRIGLSLAKGLCVGFQIPLIAVSTLEAMAWGAIAAEKDRHALYCPMIDARRLEVYTALYQHEGRIHSPEEAKVIDEDSFKDELKSQKIYFFGDGAEKCKAFIRSENAVFLSEFHISAENLGDLILREFQNENFEDLAYFQPNYFKDFKAGKPKKLL